MASSRMYATQAIHSTTTKLMIYGQDLERVKAQVKEVYRKPIEIKEHSLKGWNWGKAEFQKSELYFNVNNKPAFEIPFDEVANSNLAGRAEVAVEFVDITSVEAAAKGQKKKKVFAGVDQLMEMRFYIPGQAEAPDDDDAGSGEEGKEKDETAAGAFYNTLKQKADIGEVAGDTYAIFQDILFLTPRLAQLLHALIEFTDVAQRTIRCGHVQRLLQTARQNVRL